MIAAGLAPDAGEQAFRAAARRLLSADVPPEHVDWKTASLFADEAPLPEGPAPVLPRRFVDLAAQVICHRDGGRFALLYAIAWRLLREGPHILDMAADPQIARAALLARNVRRDIHKMHAFVRFHRIGPEADNRYAAWFEPEHRILRAATPFFADRFAAMDWLIATPEGTAQWQERTLTFGPPGPRPVEEKDAVLDAWWETYYRAIFIPSRLRVKAMTSEMPRKYWNNLPEGRLIAGMTADAQMRTRALLDTEPAPEPRFAPAALRQQERTMAQTSDPSHLASAVQGCTRCPIGLMATQAVWGEGPRDPALMIVGEQPGDEEDIAGKPFVGPAGRLLNGMLVEAGLDRSRIYVTNAVKHFKYELRGKRRIHSKPNSGEVKACRWWLTQEIAEVRPRFIVALGATAAQSLAGRAVAVTKMRGPGFDFDGVPGFVTVHPSFLLRLPDPELARRERAAFLDDLRAVATLVPDVRLAA